jgi:TolB-like protein
MSNFFEELKNRNVYKVATAYAISGWLIMQVVDTIGDNLEWPITIAATITKILIVGFPIALVLTWLYEFTPQGLKRTGAKQLDTTDNKKAGRRLNHIIIATLAITICFMLAERVFFAGNTSINKRQKASIAVLPFVNFSLEEGNEQFADGLTEEILNQLAQLSGLQVTARTSSFKFKDKNEDVRIIGEQLTVNYLLEGSIRYDSKRNRVRITAQLINASNGFHLWSKTYEEGFDEIFAIQEKVSRKVASELRVQLLPDEEAALSKVLTKNTEAYKLYILSREYSRNRNDSDLEKGMNLLKQALELDPNFAEAHAEISFLYGQRSFYGNISKEKSDEFMLFHLEKALEIAPDKPEILRVKALYNMNLKRDSSQVIADLRRAIKIKPNYADAHHMLFSALSWAKQRQLGLKSLEKAVELDPLNDFFANMLAQEYYRWYNKPEKALAILDKIIANDSSSGTLRWKSRFVALEPRGDLVQAFKLIHEAGKHDPYHMGNYNYHLRFAWDLDLLPVAEKYVLGPQMRYPDNEHTFHTVSGFYARKKEYDNLKEWINFWVAEKGLDNQTEAYSLSDYYRYVGDNAMAIQVFEEAFPGITQKEIIAADLDFGKADYLVSYIELLRFNKSDQKANDLAQVLCEYYNKQGINDFYFKNQFMMDCYYLSNDTLNFLKTLENRYFVKKDRLNVFSDLHAGWYKRFENHPGYQKLEKRITAEIHCMRAEVIAYL